VNILSPYEKYRQQSVMAASQPELTLMLYDGCIRFLNQAETYIESRNIGQSHNNLIKANNIIVELMSTLDSRYEISDSLMNLYLYIFEEITSINLTKNADKIRPVIDLIAELRDTWKQAMQIDRSQRLA